MDFEEEKTLIMTETVCVYMYVCISYRQCVN